MTDGAAGLQADVAVVGGGLSGLATAQHLARRHERVVCIEPRPWPRPAVGESLEFSAPGLLADLGIGPGTDAQGHDRRPLFPKTSVQIRGLDDEFSVWPPAWFGRAPIWCSRLAFHADRAALDHELMRRATDAGVEIIPERVTTVEHDGDVVGGLVTDGDRRIRADWFVDATGHTCRLLGRALGLERVLLGEPRAAFWTRLDEPPRGHATRLHFPEPDAEDLTWAWEIPLNPGEVSIGVVLSAARLARLRTAGVGPRQILERLLAPVPGLARRLAEHPDSDLHATAYTCYRHRRPIGPNWLLVGDASAMVDPLTSNGVTSALRHAEQAAGTVTRALDDGLGRRHAWAYRNTAPAVATTVDRAIEAFVYRPDVRRRLGLRRAVTLYAATGVITNSLYARIDPTTWPTSLACANMLAASRAWTRVARGLLSRTAPPRPRNGGRGPGAAVRPEPSGAANEEGVVAARS